MLELLLAFIIVNITSMTTIIMPMYSCYTYSYATYSCSQYSVVLCARIPVHEVVRVFVSLCCFSVCVLARAWLCLCVCVRVRACVRVCERVSVPLYLLFSPRVYQC